MNSLRIRLTSFKLKKNKKFYRIVITNKQNARDSGNFVEIVGHYNPLSKTKDFFFNEKRVKYWLAHGAQPSSIVIKLLLKTNLLKLK